MSAALRSVPTSASALPPGFVLLVAQQQGIDDGVAEFADADLQCAAIAHQAARVQADGVVDGGQRGIRWREQVVVVARMVEQQVEGVRAHVGRAEHEGHLAVYLAQHHDRLSGGAQLRELGDEIDGDIGVAAEADFGGAAHHSPGDHVSDHVDATRQQLARHVRVVRRQIVRLRVRGIEQRPGLEEELDDAHICRHRAGAHRLQVVEFRVVAEDARRQRLDERLLERRSIPWACAG